MKDYGFEAETVEIASILDELHALQNRIDDFAIEIETDDVTALQRAMGRAATAATRIHKHLSSLHTKEEMDAYNQKMEQKASALKVAALLQHVCFIEYIAMTAAGITNEDLVNFQLYYNIRLHEAGYGAWRWLGLHDTEGNCIQSDDLYRLGIRKQEEAKEIAASVIASANAKTTDTRENPDHPYDHYGWVMPDGIFYPSDFGSHEEMAIRLVKVYQWEAEQRASTYALCRDFLIHEKNACLIHNPCGIGAPIVTQGDRPLTNAQRDILVDYFRHTGDHYLTAQYLNNDEAEMER